MRPLTTEAILRRLASFPTVSRDSNLPLIDWIRNYLTDHGIDSTLIADSEGRKANLIASIGPLEDKGIVLSGHTDVVPIDGQDWNSDPFKLTSVGSRLHARGACDMKGFIAVALSCVPEWNKKDLRRPVHLMLSYDEEVGCLGAPSMIDFALKSLPKPAAVIVGEPTDMHVANEHKGICLLQTHVKGIETHSSLTHVGLSAVMLAGEIIAHLGELQREWAQCASHGNSRFKPPYTTLSVNQITGGTAINTMAAECEFQWEIRTLPGEMADPILARVSAFVETRLGALLKEGKSCTIETTTKVDVPALRMDQGEAETLVHAALASSVSITVPFASEAGQFQRAGWSTIICGPGSIAQAHKPNEFIERAQLTACEGFLDRAVAHQCTAER